MCCSVCNYAISICFIIKLLFVYACQGSVEFPKDVEDFKSLLLNGKFVDKSLLINEILNRDEKVFQITRPVKWGKTVNLEMLKTFFEVEFNENGENICDETKVNPSMFKGGEINTHDEQTHLAFLKISGIADAMEHMGKYPVISVNLKNIKGNSIPEIEKSLQNLVVDLFNRYPLTKKYLENSSDLLDVDEKARLNNFVTGNLEGEYLFDCLEFLSMILYEHFHSYVCIFVDDYDMPLINAYLNFGSRGREFEYVVEMFRTIYEYTFKENQYLFKALITGALNLEIVPSGKAEFEYKYIFYNSVFDKEFSQFYGILEDELAILKKSYNNIDLINVQKWYGGFFIDSEEIFNCGSIMNLALQKGKFEYHILNHMNRDLLNFIFDAFLTEPLLDCLHLLSDGKEIIRDQFIKSFSLKRIGNDMFSMLVQVGFLSLKPPQRVTDQPAWRMKITNFEIRSIFASAFKFIAAKELNISIAEYNAFTNLLFNKNIKEFGKRLQNFLLNLSSFNTTKKDEHLYHNLMCSIAASLGIGYLVESIKEFGLSRGEHLIIPLEGYSNSAINIEYTVCTPWQPLEQFVHSSFNGLLHRPRHCTFKVRRCQHVSEILYVAIGFCGQKVILKYKTVSVR